MSLESRFFRISNNLVTLPVAFVLFPVMVTFAFFHSFPTTVAFSDVIVHALVISLPLNVTMICPLAPLLAPSVIGFVVFWAKITASVSKFTGLIVNSAVPVFGDPDVAGDFSVTVITYVPAAIKAFSCTSVEALFFFVYLTVYWSLLISVDGVDVSTTLMFGFFAVPSYVKSPDSTVTVYPPAAPLPSANALVGIIQITKARVSIIAKVFFIVLFLSPFHNLNLFAKMLTILGFT